MASNERNADSLRMTKRDELMLQYLLERGIASMEEAPDELMEEATAYADSILGAGNDD